jgi:membrane protease YdiL (CAAX protease family)
VTEEGTESDDSSSKLESTIQRSLISSSFWLASMSFGVAHIPAGPFPGITLQWYYVSKYIGTTISSFLVERRLFCNRRTIWAAIGAHVTYNAHVPLKVGVLDRQC